MAKTGAETGAGTGAGSGAGNGAEGGARLPAVQGALQALQPRRVRGWAWLPAARDEHLSIEVRVDGAVVAQTQAGSRFADLQRNKIGDGDHGFVIELEHDLPLAEPERIAVVAASMSGLSRTLRPWQGPPAPSPAPPPPPQPALQRRTLPPRARVEMGEARIVLPRLTAQDRAQRPVFVLGSARSGTTAMMHALRATGRYSGFGEGHFLPLFTRLESTIAMYYARSLKDAAPGMNTFIAHVTAQTMMEALQNGMVEIIRTAFPSGQWIDKTPGPEMVRAAPAMRRIWPHAQFIFMKRHPIDNIESRRRKFPTIDFADHCKLWADSMVSWLAVRGDLAEAAVEIDQAELAGMPQAVSQTLAARLALTAGEAERMLASLQTERPQRTGSGAAATDFSQVAWTSGQRKIFQRICADAAQAFGYEGIKANR